MTARLHIGEQQTQIEVEHDGQEPVTLVLPLGTASLAHRHFRHRPPTPAELEAAIEVVEDALMPLIPRLRGPGTLLTHDAESLALAEFAGLLPRTALEIDLATVERQFNRLVDVANGRPALTEGLPPRATFAANLLILRELMHHAGRVSVTVAPLVPGNEKPGNPEQLPASPPMEKAP